MDSNRPAGDACPHCGQWHEPSLARCPVTGATLAPPPVAPSLVGHTVGGRYLARKLLGSGSLGPVYVGEHIDFQRPVIIRVLVPEFAPPESAARVFFGEGRTAWALAHPNLCEVLDIGTMDSGAPYIIYEKLAGETLARRLARGGRLSVGAAIDLMLQLLSALGHAHGRGVVHRDVRPENVFLAERRGCRPLVKVLDFGLGKLVSPSRMGQRWRDDGVVPSMPFYLPPERARGDQGTDDRGDLFAAGVILYEALTGERPFRAASFNDLMVALARGEFVPATRVRPELPAPIDAVLAKALAVGRDARYASADQWQDDLRALYELSRYEKMARGEEFSAVHAQPPAYDPYDDRGEDSVAEATRVGRADVAALVAHPPAHVGPGRAGPPAAFGASPGFARRDSAPDSEAPLTATAARNTAPPAEAFDDDADHAPTLPPPAGFSEAVDSEPSLVTTQARAPVDDDAEPNTVTGAAAAAPVAIPARPVPAPVEVPYVAVPPAVEASRPVGKATRPPGSRLPPAPKDDDDEHDDRTEKVRLTPELIEKLRSMKAGADPVRAAIAESKRDGYDEEERPTRVEKAPPPEELARSGATLKSRGTPSRRKG
ncbi:MAG: protein kinase [Myxococcales bacterium]|nr:protein kinase [Myxococcales bacterium]